MSPTDCRVLMNALLTPGDPCMLPVVKSFMQEHSHMEMACEQMCH